MSQTPTAICMIRGVAGAIVGGVLGLVIFRHVANLLVLPGLGIGLGFGLACGRRSVPAGAVCAVVALPVAILAEWWAHPFLDDRSLGFFLSHLNHLGQFTWLMIFFGMFFAYRLGVGREAAPRRYEDAPLRPDDESPPS